MRLSVGLAKDLVYTRYSDDIIVSGKNAAAVKGLEESLVTTLVEIFMGEFRLHQGKSKLLQEPLSRKR
jgi:RNA-directed DNA polymerase